jgi:hypothetical protein
MKDGKTGRGLSRRRDQLGRLNSACSRRVREWRVPVTRSRRRETPIATTSTPWGGLSDTICLGVTRAELLRVNCSRESRSSPSRFPNSSRPHNLAGVPAFIAHDRLHHGDVGVCRGGLEPHRVGGCRLHHCSALCGGVLIRLAPVSTTLYFELVAATAVITGLAVMTVGLLEVWGGSQTFLSLADRHGLSRVASASSSLSTSSRAPSVCHRRRDERR